MTILELAKASDSHTDELLIQGDVGNFANQAISLINTELKTRLPMIENINEKYDALKIHWQRQIIGNYLSWGIKMQDGSLNEADRYLELVMRAIRALEDVMYGPEEDGSGGEIDVEYLDPSEIEARNARLDSAKHAPSWFTDDWR